MDLTKLRDTSCYSPEEVNQIFEKFKVKDNGEGRYYCTSGYEFGIMLHRLMMCFEGPTKGRETFAVDRGLARAIPSYTTIVYGKLVYNDNLGLVSNGVLMATTRDLIAEYESNVQALCAHFEALDGSVLYHVSTKELLEGISALYERESKYAPHYDAFQKAIAKALQNLDNDEDFTIGKVKGKLHIYK